MKALRTRTHQELPQTQPQGHKPNTGLNWVPHCIWLFHSIFYSIFQSLPELAFRANSSQGNKSQKDCFVCFVPVRLEVPFSRQDPLDSQTIITYSCQFCDSE